jgi:two-component system cell cycle sensor histidine kinase/response regulator CckA
MPNKYPYRDLASASATDLQALLHRVSRLEQAGNSAEDRDSVPVSPRRSQPGEARSRRRRSQATIFVVDDEESVREMLVELLRIHGYRVLTAASVEEAEGTKRRLGVEGIHLVITDIHLTPAAQARAGYALAQRWRAEHRGLPIILISGDPSNQDLPEVRDGSLRFVLKPFQMETFLEVVREALGR